MSVKNSELFVRMGKLFLVVTMLCVAFVVTYFLIMMSSGKYLHFSDSQKLEVEKEYEAVTVMAKIFSVDENNLVLLEEGTGRSLSLVLSSASKIEKYNSVNRTIDVLNISSLISGLPVMATFNHTSKLIEKITILPATVSGRVLRNVAGVVTIDNLSQDNSIRTDINTLVSKQDGLGSIESDLTIADVVIDDRVLITLSDSGDRLASEISILSISAEEPI
ncbi:MAG: hypothetical protein ACOZAR_04955 [Patescibacteria group bacterium]